MNIYYKVINNADSFDKCFTRGGDSMKRSWYLPTSCVALNQLQSFNDPWNPSTNELSSWVAELIYFFRYTENESETNFQDASKFCFLIKCCCHFISFNVTVNPIKIYLGRRKQMNSEFSRFTFREAKYLVIQSLSALALISKTHLYIELKPI